MATDTLGHTCTFSIQRLGLRTVGGYHRLVPLTVARADVIGERSRQGNQPKYIRSPVCLTLVCIDDGKCDDGGEKRSQHSSPASSMLWYQEREHIKPPLTGVSIRNYPMYIT